MTEKATKKTFNVRTLLRGLKPARMQTVGNMQVIPLILDMEADERFAPPLDLMVSNRTYGHVHIKNNDTRPVIVPTHATYLTKQSAQDHALMSATMVKEKGTVDINTAACVQRSQGGTIREEKAALQILPYAMREASLLKRKIQSYGKVWEDIDKFNRLVNVSGGSHLEYFASKYKDVMDKFVAEFELLPNQIGAIILIDGVVHGIERGPNPAYWAAVWEPLIRMCYGSQAIALNMKAKSGKTPKGTIPVNVPLRSKINSLAELKDALEEAEEKEQENAAEAIRKLLDDNFDQEKDEAFKIDQATLNLLTIKNGQFLGQVFMDGDRVSYASMVTTEKWQGKRVWEEAPEFKV